MLEKFEWVLTHETFLKEVIDKADKLRNVLMKEHLLFLNKFLESSKLQSPTLNDRNAVELEYCDVEENEVYSARNIDPHEDDTSSVDDEVTKMYLTRPLNVWE